MVSVQAPVQGKRNYCYRLPNAQPNKLEDPKVLNATIAKLPGADQFCTCDPHLIGKEVFGSQKYKADVPLGFEGKSHRPDKINFFSPQIATRSARTNHVSCIIPDVVEELSLELQEDQAPM
jgi:hypothetical protein